MNGLLFVFVHDFHFVLLLFVIFLVLVDFFHHGFRFFEEFEELVNVVLDFLLFLFNFVVVSLRLFLLISVSYHKLNIFLFALLELEEVGLLAFDKVQNWAVLDFEQRRVLSEEKSFFQTEEKLFFLVGFIHFWVEKKVLKLFFEFFNVLLENELHWREFSLEQINVLVVYLDEENVNVFDDNDGLERLH